MEIKKSPKANLENKKLLLREIGLVVSLLVVLGAFQWSSADKATSVIQQENTVAVEEDNVPITTDVPPPPPEVPNEPQMSDIIDIVDDDVKVDNSLLISTEDNNLGVKIVNYVVGAQQEEEEIAEEEVPFAIVEKKPLFDGQDQNAFTKWVSSQMVYPEIAKENGIQGRVTLQFTVDTDGSVKNVKVLRGIDSSLDKEAVRIVSSSPKWTPGQQRNKNVKVTFTFPVIFQLR